MPHDEQDTQSADELEALQRLLLVSTLITDDMAAVLESRGLTRARATVVWEVARRGPMTQRELADVLKVTPRNVTTLVDALQQGGHVTRGSHATDRRAVQVQLTAEGAAAADQLEAEAAELAQALFGDLPADDLATFVRVLDQVAGHFS